MCTHAIAQLKGADTQQLQRTCLTVLADAAPTWGCADRGVLAAPAEA